VRLAREQRTEAVLPVGATYYGTSVPSTHRPPFRVAEGARLVTPNALPQLWKQAPNLPAHFVILGGGKTAMDVGVYLQQCGAAPAQIHWVRPRDSWMINRRSVQPLMRWF
jgi:hypothetical protein